MLRLAKKILTHIGIDVRNVHERLSGYSIKLAIKQNGYAEMLERLRTIVPDISNQESSEASTFNDYWELKRRTLHVFQCRMMLKALEMLQQDSLVVVDIGDSAGTHMLYLRDLTRNKFSLDTVSVNLDPRAIKKIEARGLKAVHCRAEELDLGGRSVDLFTSFQMVEHLHNPALFFRRLAKKSSCCRMVITVPYLKRSRVGLHHTRYGAVRPFFAEDEHIFELCPRDWELLILHAGWRVKHSEIYYQYPRRIPVVSTLLSWFWKNTDYEGFWGAVLEKDTTLSDCYQDWEN
ncbi:methyltransferase domain-containing protein [Dissulfurispira sp.]|uniref:methyltransferase domain-containing protein n=1 Tax=Dissulfurispira sp. TaxID=2817609 RepID=UPI002FD9BA07